MALVTFELISLMIYDEQCMINDSRAATIAALMMQILIRCFQVSCIVFWTLPQHVPFDSIARSNFADRYGVSIFGPGRSTCPETELWHWTRISLTTTSTWHEPYLASMYICVFMIQEIWTSLTNHRSGLHWPS